MREIVIKYFGRLLAVLGCSTIVTACYGVPEVPFEVKGRVADAETGKPIENIKVTVLAGAQYGSTSGVGSVSTPGYSQSASAYTSEDGKFEVTVYEYYTPEAYIVECEDSDGQANGEYEYVKMAVTLGESQDIQVYMTPKGR